DKGNIKLEIIPNTSNSKEQYIYKISKNVEKEKEMDTVERFIYNWIFSNESDGINLQKRLETIAKDKISVQNIKKLNKHIKNITNNMRANKAKVPVPIRVLNVGILIIAILEVIRHVMFNGFDVYTSNWSVLAILLGSALQALPL